MSGPIIHVLGTVGSGKGTQVELLSKRYSMPSISAGDLFRRAAALPTAFGRHVEAILTSGQLMPIDLWSDVVRSYLGTADFSRGYLLDGVVRSLEQVEHFNQLLTERSLPDPWALVIRVSDPVALDRIRKRGRSDTDSEAATRKRLAWSREQTVPVIDYYRTRARAIIVNGDQPVTAVHRAIVTALENAGVLPEQTR